MVLAFFILDLCFSTAVYPERIDIYETYNPGAVVRILACNKAPHQAYIYGELVQYACLFDIKFLLLCVLTILLYVCNWNSYRIFQEYLLTYCNKCGDFCEVK